MKFFYSENSILNLINLDLTNFSFKIARYFLFYFDNKI